MKKTEIAFPTYDGLYTLRGSVYLPDAPDKSAPVIIMSAGLADSAKRLEPSAEAFVKDGFGVLLYEHRNTGISDGEPRLEIDPVAQSRDMRMAITFAQSFEGFDAERIGLWGASFSGAHVLDVSAYDKRVKAVVSLIPWISGFDVVVRAGGLPALEAFQKMIIGEWQKVLAGDSPTLVTLGRGTKDPSQEFSLFRDDAAMNYFENGPVGKPDTWRNQFTLRSLAYLVDYDLRAHAKRISPTPLMMILALEDKTMPAEPAFEFFQNALEPKELVTVPGGHYDIYMPNGTFRESHEAASRWFKNHL